MSELRENRLLTFWHILELNMITFRSQSMSIDENCCGAAGIYSILQQSTSQRILEKKLANLLKESPDLILTANPGCMIQIEQGLKSKASNTQILHIIELLYQSYITEIS